MIVFWPASMPADYYLAELLSTRPNRLSRESVMVRSCDHTFIQSPQASLLGSAEISAGKPGFLSTTGPKLTPFLLE